MALGMAYTWVLRRLSVCLVYVCRLPVLGIDQHLGQSILRVHSEVRHWKKMWGGTGNTGSTTLAATAVVCCDGLSCNCGTPNTPIQQPLQKHCQHLTAVVRID